jgi:ribosomal protein S19
VNKTLVIENGIVSKAIKITVDHVGHRAGEFLQTKKRVVFKNKK